MRPITLRLVQNPNGSVLDVSDALLEDGMGALRQSTDEHLTLIDAGDLNVTLSDHDESIWAWFQARLSEAAGKFPPFLMLDIDGTRRFTGTIAYEDVTREVEDRQLKLSARGWAQMLADQDLIGPDWERQPPSQAEHWMIGEETRPSTVPYTGLLLSGNKMEGTADAIWLGPSPWVMTGDWLEVREGGTLLGTFKVLRTYQTDRTWMLSAGGSPVPGDWFAQLAGFLDAYHALHGNPPQGPPAALQVTRLASSTAPGFYFEVAASTPTDNQGTPEKQYFLPLTSVEGLAVGDELQRVSSDTATKWDILSLDPQLNRAYTRQEAGRLMAGDRVYFTKATVEELVQQDARRLILTAAHPYKVDLTRFTPAALPTPALSWLPTRPLQGADIRPPHHVEALRDRLQVLSGPAAWEGTPEDGWTASTPGYFAPWTDQTTQAPATLMPLAGVDDTPRGRPVNFAFRRHVRLQDGEIPGEDPAGYSKPRRLQVYDYRLMRRYEIAGDAWIRHDWTGALWVQQNSGTFPSEPLSAAVMPGLAGAVVYVTATSVALTVLEGATYTAALPTDAKGAVVRTTPWGAYLVAAQGYGRIDWTGAGIVVRWVTLTQQVGAFFPTTFAGLDGSRVFMLGRFDAMEQSGEVLTETWGFLLRALPDAANAAASVLWSERVAEGAPPTCGAVRDPLRAERIVGHCGGRLFQVARELPFNVDRFKPAGMTAGELIEHICQLHQAVAYPGPDGTLHIVSRGLAEQIHDLTVDQVTVEQTAAWPHHYSRVAVSGSEEGTAGWVDEASGATVPGGGLLEVKDHPLVATASVAQGMAESLAVFFGRPRSYERQQWVSLSDTARPWEGLPPLPLVRVNGAPEVWLLLGLEVDEDEGTATAELLEWLPPALGFSYGDE